MRELAAIGLAAIAICSGCANRQVVESPIPTIKIDEQIGQAFSGYLSIRAGWIGRMPPLIICDPISGPLVASAARGSNMVSSVRVMSPCPRSERDGGTVVDRDKTLVLRSLSASGDSIFAMMEEIGPLALRRERVTFVLLHKGTPLERLILAEIALVSSLLD